MNKKVDALDLPLGKPKDLILPASGEVTRDDLIVDGVESAANGDYQAQLAFMEEPVEITVHESTDINAENPVQLICNGINQFVVRGVPQTIKRKYVEILARAKQTNINTTEMLDGNGDRAIRIGKHTGLRYPFSVVQDTNPRGAAWLRNVLADA